MSVQVVAELVTTGGLDPLTIARWQFGITTVYHFLMVPLTLGLGAVVVFLQARWVGTGDERWLRMTRFWGKLYLINFIMGVATGLVQEFQFGLAWSEYSRFVGDVFGAPLALEGLFGFFIESTFLGLWIFGWKALPKRLHLTVLILGRRILGVCLLHNRRELVDAASRRGATGRRASYYGRLLGDSDQ